MIVSRKESLPTRIVLRVDRCVLTDRLATIIDLGFLPTLVQLRKTTRVVPELEPIVERKYPLTSRKVETQSVSVLTLPFQFRRETVEEDC